MIKVANTGNRRYNRTPKSYSGVGREIEVINRGEFNGFFVASEFFLVRLRAASNIEEIDSSVTEPFTITILTEAKGGVIEVKVALLVLNTSGIRG